MLYVLHSGLVWLAGLAPETIFQKSCRLASLLLLSDVWNQCPYDVGMLLAFWYNIDFFLKVPGGFSFPKMNHSRGWCYWRGRGMGCKLGSEYPATAFMVKAAGSWACVALIWLTTENLTAGQVMRIKILFPWSLWQESSLWNISNLIKTPGLFLKTLSVAQWIRRRVKKQRGSIRVATQKKDLSSSFLWNTEVCWWGCLGLFFAGSCRTGWTSICQEWPLHSVLPCGQGWTGLVLYF